MSCHVICDMRITRATSGRWICHIMSCNVMLSGLCCVMSYVLACVTRARHARQDLSCSVMLSGSCHALHVCPQGHVMSYVTCVSPGPCLGGGPDGPDLVEEGGQGTVAHWQRLEGNCGGHDHDHDPDHDCVPVYLLRSLST